MTTSANMAEPAPSANHRPGEAAGTTVHVVLVPGFWLGGWAWDDVVPGLRAAGLVAHAVTLPGLDRADLRTTGPTTRSATIDAVRDLTAQLTGDVVLVGHSGGGPVIQQLADADPGRYRRMIFVDSGPLTDGAVLSRAVEGDTIPLPSWEELAAQGSSIEGIDTDGLARFRERAVPQPAAVTTEPIRLDNPDRFRIPVTAICTSIPSETLRQIATPDGPLHAELLEYDVAWVDLPTGHWPMFSRPAELAAAIATAALS